MRLLVIALASMATGIAITLAFKRFDARSVNRTLVCVLAVCFIIEAFGHAWFFAGLSLATAAWCWRDATKEPAS